MHHSKRIEAPGDVKGLALRGHQHQVHVVVLTALDINHPLLVHMYGREADGGATKIVQPPLNNHWNHLVRHAPL
jgi:hypothetical protein